MSNNLLSVELYFSQSASGLTSSGKEAGPFASAHTPLFSQGQQQTALHQPELAPFPQQEQVSPFLSAFWPSHSPEFNSVLVAANSLDTLLSNGGSLTQPIVGILDDGFDLGNSTLTADPFIANSRIYLGYDWVEGDRNPLVSAPSSHGSQVLAAFAAPDADSSGTNLWLGRTVGSGNWAASLVEFVTHAKALGHRNAVANLSFDLVERQADGSLAPREYLNLNEIAALEYAQQQGVIVVAAAGNDNASLSALASASQQFDNLISVGAATIVGAVIHRADYSNYGEGLSLLATVPESLSSSPQGTSLATAQVTQVIQELWQQNTDLSYRQIIDLLQSSATDLQAPGWDHETGHGLLNPAHALQAATQIEGEIASAALNTTFSTSTAAINPLDFASPNPLYLERPLALDVAQVTPGNGTTNIDTQASIRVQFASEAVDPTTLTSDSFQLLDSNGTPVTATIGSDLTGGVISLTPVGPLDPFSSYSINITAALLNTQGEAATPFSTSFTTGVQGSSPAGLGFNNQAIINNESRFGVSSIAVGPDGNVYASDILGNILRYNLDPSTGLATSTDTVFAQGGAQIVGIAFDPNATATDLQLWVSYASSSDTTGFSGTISKLGLPAIAGGNTTKQDYITGLPNAVAFGIPHQPNGIAFGPDGKLYQAVGGVATLGGTPNWGVNESLLSAAVIAADVNDANFPTNQSNNPVNVQTTGLGSGNYDPFAPNAPVEIFATGLRNAYDLAWHSNGNLYSGINQNSIGGNVLTPASPDGSVPAINARPNEMLALIEDGKYYGHPNPARGEYVLNGGNPTAGFDVREVTEYPVGVQPDPDFDPSLIYDTRSIGGTSPNGLTEYTGSGFLNGRLLVSFFSGARTIQSFELGSNGLVTATNALQDSNGNNLQFFSPLDVAVHPSGRIYVADFGFSQNNPNGGNVRALTPLASAGVVITPSNGSTELSEAGGTDSYSVALATQPSGSVSISINPDGEISSDSSSITFNASNWNIPQTITLSAVDDSRSEDLHSGSVSHNITSGSGDYGTGLAIASLFATITDNDSVGIQLIESGGSTAVTEGANSDIISISLTSEPEDNVVLTLASDGQLDLGGANSGTVDLTFTPTNWNTAQPVTINALDDALVEGSHSGNLSYSIASADEDYEALTIDDTVVIISDNDTTNNAPEIFSSTQLASEQYLLGDTLSLQQSNPNFPETSFVIDEDGANDVTFIDFKLTNTDSNTTFDVADVTSSDITNFGRWGNFSYNLVLSGFSTGNYEITAVAFDQQGAQSDVWSDTFSLIESNNAPEIFTFNQLTAEQYFVGETLSFQQLSPNFSETSFVIDEDGAEDVTLIDFKLINTDTNTLFDIADVTSSDITNFGRWGNFSYNLALSGFSAGNYELTAVAFDQQGAQSDVWSDTFSLIEFNNAPEIFASNQLTSEQYFFGDTLSFQQLSPNFPETSFVIDEDGADDVTLIDFKLRNTDTNILFDIADITASDITSFGRWGNFSYNLALSGFSAGNYELTATAFDQQGAQSSVWSDTFTLASPGPVSIPPSNDTTPSSGIDLTWQPLNEPGSGGRISSVSFSPHNSNQILIGGDLLGVGRSTDSGQSWQRPTGFITSFEIEEFTWHPTNPNIVWVATREGPYRSIDGGQSWEAKRQGMPAEFTNDAWLTSPIHKIIYGTDGSLLAFGGNHSEFNAGNANRFSNYGAIWESSDDGESWSIRGRINPSDTGSGYNIKGITYAADNQTLYAAVESRGVYRSTDQGGTWSPMNGGQLNDANDIAAHPSQADTLWVSSESGLYKTTDGGTTWSAINNGISSSHVNGAWQVIKVAPSNPEVLFAGNYSDTVLYRSTDGGDSWLELESYPDTAFDEAITPHSLNIDPNNENRIIIGTYVSAYISEDQGDSWLDATSQRADVSANEWKGRGFSGWVGNNIEWNPYQPNQVVFQAFDEGTLWLSDDLEGWRNLRERPDGSLNEISQFGGGWDVSFAADGQTIYATLNQQFEDYDPNSRGIAKSLDGGTTWAYLTTQPGDIDNKIEHAYEIHSLAGNTDYLWVRVEQELWYSGNGGNAWERIALDGSAVLDIAAPTDIVSNPTDAVIYVATESGVYQFKDNLWTALGGPGNGEGVELEVDPHDSSNLYLVNWNASNGGLYRLENGAWIQLSDERYIRDVAVSPIDPELLIAVTNQNPFKMSNDAPGLLISEDGGQTWRLDNDGLGVIRAQTVEFSPDGQQIIVGTTGGGFFISDVG